MTDKAAEISRQGLVALVASVIACAICQAVSRPSAIHAQSSPVSETPAYDAQTAARAPLPPRVGCRASAARRTQGRCVAAPAIGESQGVGGL